MRINFLNPGYISVIKKSNKVWALPYDMKEDFAKPAEVKRFE